MLLVTLLEIRLGIRCRPTVPWHIRLQFVQDAIARRRLETEALCQQEQLEIDAELGLMHLYPYRVRRQQRLWKEQGLVRKANALQCVDCGKESSIYSKHRHHDSCPRAKVAS